MGYLEYPLYVCFQQNSCLFVVPFARWDTCRERCILCLLYIKSMPARSCVLHCEWGGWLSSSVHFSAFFWVLGVWCRKTTVNFLGYKARNIGMWKLEVWRWYALFPGCWKDAPGMDWPIHLGFRNIFFPGLHCGSAETKSSCLLYSWVAICVVWCGRSGRNLWWRDLADYCIFHGLLENEGGKTVYRYDMQVCWPASLSSWRFVIIWLVAAFERVTKFRTLQIHINCSLTALACTSVGLAAHMCSDICFLCHQCSFTGALRFLGQVGSQSPVHFSHPQYYAFHQVWDFLWNT